MFLFIGTREMEHCFSFSWYYFCTETGVHPSNNQWPLSGSWVGDRDQSQWLRREALHGETKASRPFQDKKDHKSRWQMSKQTDPYPLYSARCVLALSHSLKLPTKNRISRKFRKCKKVVLWTCHCILLTAYCVPCSGRHFFILTSLSLYIRKFF